LFDAPVLQRRAPGGPVVATRLVVAGAAWDAETVAAGVALAVRAVSSDVASHHDRRLGIAAPGSLDAPGADLLVRAAGFVCGIDLELLRVERYDAERRLVESEDHRGLRRLGRFPHSPFDQIPVAARGRAFGLLVAALRAADPAGVPLALIVDQIGASNVVQHIHLSAQLLAFAATTAAYHEVHGLALDATPGGRADELAALNARLGLGLGVDDIARYAHLCVELLDAGFFHAPGYETGRPQRDIKFLRDIAHRIVFRLAGYEGPYYGSETGAPAVLGPA
jgi:hypothetical protein